MSWDIYGNPLRRGHCEVHPHVHEEYPCSVCIAERNRSQQQPDYELERLNYELDQQNEYIKELTLSNQHLNMALQKVSDYNLRLENERDALAALVEEFKKIRSDWGGMAINDCKTLIAFIQLSDKTPQQCLRDVQAEAGRAGYVAGVNDRACEYMDHSQIQAGADYYAAKVRQGGEQ